MDVIPYVITGRVLPERLAVDSHDVKLAVNESDGCPSGTLKLQILRSQIVAHFAADGEVSNHLTLRNRVEDAARILLDAVGYVKGWGIDAEIDSITRADTGERWVPGIDIPGLVEHAEKAGLSVENVIAAVAKRDGYYLRRAISDFREAIKSPDDTGLFCYRAVESLKNCVAERLKVDAEDGKKSWRAFRDYYGFAKDDILAIKEFADPVRHGDYRSRKPVKDKDRLQVFQIATKILTTFIKREINDGN